MFCTFIRTDKNNKNDRRSYDDGTLSMSCLCPCEVDFTVFNLRK